MVDGKRRCIVCGRLGTIGIVGNSRRALLPDAVIFRILEADAGQRDLRRAVADVVIDHDLQRMRAGVLIKGVVVVLGHGAVVVQLIDRNVHHQGCRCGAGGVARRNADRGGAGRIRIERQRQTVAARVEREVCQIEQRGSYPVIGIIVDCHAVGNRVAFIGHIHVIEVGTERIVDQDRGRVLVLGNAVIRTDLDRRVIGSVHGDRKRVRHCCAAIRIFSLNGDIGSAVLVRRVVERQCRAGNRTVGARDIRIGEQCRIGISGQGQGQRIRVGGDIDIREHITEIDRRVPGILVDRDIGDRILHGRAVIHRSDSNRDGLTVRQRAA